MRARWLWLLALVWPVAGGVVAGAWGSDAGVVIGAFSGLLLAPVAALLATWTLLRKIHWLPRALAGVIVGLGWSVVAFLLFFVAYVLAGGEVAYAL